MKLAVSNIAWTDSEEAAVVATLQAEGVEAIEVAPARLSGDPLALEAGQIVALTDRWAAFGLPIASMQALLYRQPDLALFAPDHGAAFLAYLTRVMALAGRLGVGPAVFGSPKNRLKGGLSMAEAVAAAAPVLRNLGDAAAARGVTLCLEANAVGYGCDFMTCLDEAARVARAVNHAAVGLVVDTGNMQMAGDRVEDALRHSGLVRHFHVSRPGLAAIDGSDAFAADVLRALAGAGYDGQVTVEMRRVDADPVGAVARAAGLVRGWIDA